MSRSIAELLSIAETDRDLDWLEESLQGAVKLEFATIPLYLAALWSIKDPLLAPVDNNAPEPPGPTWPSSACFDPYAVLRGIAVEEMLHLGLVCNMLTTIGRVPDIVGAVPSLPSQGLPGKVRPDLRVSLAGLTPDRLKNLFMQIEYPENPVRDDPPPPPPPPGEYATIGALYDAIAKAFESHPQSIITGQNQCGDVWFANYGCTHATGDVADWLVPLNSLFDVKYAIKTIKEQGEGTSTAPDAPQYEDELAHYFKFGSLLHGRLYVQGPDGTWDYTGEPIQFPDVALMQEVPEGGYPDPAPDVCKALQDFNEAFSSMVDKLQDAWKGGGQDALSNPNTGAVTAMFNLATLAGTLYEMPVPGTKDQTYGPTFEYIPSAS